MMKALLISVVSAALLLTPAAASAQGKKSGSALVCTNKKKSKLDFAQGRLAYRRGDLEVAILKWQDSYAACQKALTLFNIGNAYERLGDLKNALKYFEEYLPLAKEAESVELKARMDSLRTRIAGEDKIEADRLAKEEEARKAEEALKRKEEEARQLNNKPDASGGSVVPLVGWTLVGVGAAAVLAGVVMDAVAASSRPDEEQACTSSTGRMLCLEVQRDDIQSSNTLALVGDITWIAGSVITASGVTLLVLSATGAFSSEAKGDQGDAKQADDAVIKDAYLAPFGAGLQVFGTF